MAKVFLMSTVYKNVELEHSRKNGVGRFDHIIFHTNDEDVVRGYINRHVVCIYKETKLPVVSNQNKAYDLYTVSASNAKMAVADEPVHHVYFGSVVKVRRTRQRIVTI